LRWAGTLDFETWYLEVQQAAQNEYSVDRGTYIAGITIVAVPVRQPNSMPTHTLVCASLTNQLTEADLTDLINQMRLQANLATSV
jgi:DNA-binding IclR family transcriptional regulator